MSNYYKSVVLEDAFTKKVVGGGTLFIEKKFIRDAGTGGHLEDIIVKDPSHKGKIVWVLTQLAYELGCYKVIVDIPNKDKPIYIEKGYKVKGAGM